MGTLAGQTLVERVAREVCTEKELDVMVLLWAGRSQRTVCLALGIDPLKQLPSNVGRPIRIVDKAAKPIQGITL